MIVLGSESFSSVSGPIQHAAVVAFNEVDQKYVDSCKKVLADISFYAYSTLENAGLITSEPDGGFYIFIDFANFRGKLEGLGITTSNELAGALLDRLSVAALSGEACEREPNELSIRLACVNFDGAKALEGVRDYDGPLNNDFIHRYCKETVEAIDLIAEWVGSL
jgi:aspartate aminotransferase